MAENYSLKDIYFNNDTISYLADKICQAYPDFDKNKFIESVLGKFKGLELKERIDWISTNLRVHLPDDYQTACDIMLKSLKDETNEGQFIFASYSDYVMKYGCTDDYADQSLDYLEAYTKVFSAEFGIRPFINTYPEKTYQKMLSWTGHEHEEVRRLASEGLRPKLPWATNIDFDYAKTVNILDLLYMDEVRYVTRSVANHLNDISKTDPELVYATLKRWSDEGKQTTDEMAYIVNHSLRTLIKRGAPETMAFLGYSSQPKVSVTSLIIETPAFKIGDSLVFNLEIESLNDEKLIIDYDITYPTPTAKLSRKTFKLKKVDMKNGQILTLTKKHPFRKMTTKKLYTGDYIMEIKINGNTYAQEAFHITV